VAEPSQEIRIVVWADHARLRPAHGTCEPPADVDQYGQNENQEQIRHENLLEMNIRAIGTLGFVTEDRPRSRLALDLLAYVLARLLLVAVLTAVIFGAGHLLGVRDFPLVVALLFALVIALPLGIWMFAPLRRRATASVAALDERRRKDREQLQARLRGEQTSGSETPPAE
jgi:hypothetical protein